MARVAGILLAWAVAGTAVLPIAGTAVGAAAPLRHDVGLVDTTQGQWHLRDADGGATAFYFGDPNDVPFMGNWDGNPVDTVAQYRPSDGFFYGRNSNSAGVAEFACFAGNPDDVPLSGDWTGTGFDTLGLYRPSNQTFYLFTSPCVGAPMGAAQIAFVFGDPGDRPFAGDLDGDGRSEVALHRPSTGRVYYRETLTSGPADRDFIWGNPDDVVFAGDWNGDGTDTIGLFRPSEARFYVRNSNSAGVHDESFSFGEGGWRPVSGATGEAAAPIAGPPGDPVNDHVPDIPFPDPPPADLVAPSGIPISTRDLVVAFRPNATVGAANRLLGSLPAAVVGGNPAAALLLVRLTGPSDLARVLAAQATLLADPLVAAASINYAQEDDQLPPHNVDTGDNRWTWEVPLTAGSGNWGMKTIRMPQAWNLYDRAVRSNATIDVLIMDDSANAAADTHPDLANVNKLRATDPVGDHDTMIAGIIGATWHNRLGVEGVYPRPLTIYSRWEAYWGTLADTTTRVLRVQDRVRVVTLSAGLSKRYRDNGIDPVTDRVNPNAPAGPANPTWRDQMVISGNAFLAAMQAWEGGDTGRSDYLMFCSAGNLRLRPGANPAADYEARDNSACANVAVRGVGGAGLPDGGARADHFIAVEATDAAGNRASFSAAAGTLSAPGRCVRSTEANDANNYDVASCPAADAADQSYATNSGTSFATPYAGGLAAYLWSLDSALTYQDVRQVVTAAANRVRVPAGAPPGADGAERVDGFAAAMGIDIVRGNRNLQRALVDVDDGSLLDGNARTDRDDEDDDDNTTELYPLAINRPDSRRGDGTIGMRDFRAFRDALLQAMVEGGVLDTALVTLDGGAAHFKKDLNVDGCVRTSVASPAHPTVASPASCANGPAENVYARYDFNGDGRVNGREVNPLPAEVAPFKVDPDTACLGRNNPAGCLRDVDVLVDPAIWTTDAVERVAAGDGAETQPCGMGSWGPTNFALKDRDGNGVVDYLLSMDVHFAIGPINPGYDVVGIRVRSLRAPTAPPDPWLRCIEIPGPGAGTHKLIVTVPLFDPRRVGITIVANDLQMVLPPLAFAGEETRTYGQDLLCVFETAVMSCS